MSWRLYWLLLALLVAMLAWINTWEHPREARCRHRGGVPVLDVCLKPEAVLK